MEIVNIIIAGVGGQGLVLTTDLIAQAAFIEGYEVATNDVIGLSQRGGKVNGSVRFGKTVPTPNVPAHSASVLLGLEELEALRFVDEVVPGGLVLMNKKQIYPNPVLMEKAEYPEDIEEQIKTRDVRLVHINSEEEAKKLGNIKVANTVLIGALSTVVDIKEESFIKAIETKVPPKTIEANLKAFAFGRELMGAAAMDTSHIKSAPATEPVKEDHPMDPEGETVIPESKKMDENPKVASGSEDLPSWVCLVCGYVYDPANGDPDNGVDPGTAWEDVPEHWTCPLCGVGKDQFELN